MRVIYHGSQTQWHGAGELVGSFRNRYMIELDTGLTLENVHRESFTILDDDLDNQILDVQYRFSD